MLKRDPLIETLRAFPALAGLPKKELKVLARAGRQVEHPAGSVILKQGAGAAALHLVLEGEASVSIDGTQVATLGAGDVFGELAFLDDAPRSAGVIAQTAMRLHSVAAWGVSALFEAAPELNRTVVEAVRARRGG